jgi:hypothetical protein
MFNERLGVLALAGFVLQDPAQLLAVQNAILSVLPSQVAPAIREPTYPLGS